MKALVVMAIITFVVGCTTPRERVMPSTTASAVVMTFYPDQVRVTDRARTAFDAERAQRRRQHAARVFEPSQAMAVDPDRAAVLRYGRFTDEDSAANDLLHLIGGVTWNGMYTALTFALGDAMVHMDTTMGVRSGQVTEAAVRVGAQYAVAMPSVVFDLVDTMRTCSARVVITYVPKDSVLLDTMVIGTDRGGLTKFTYDRGGTWASACTAAGLGVGDLLPERIKATLPRYVERARIMRERKAWFVQHLAQTVPDDELLYALALDTLQPPDAFHHWMLRSPDGSKALVATVSTFPTSAGLRYMRGNVGPTILPDEPGDTARMGWTLYAMERVEDRWLFGRMLTVFRSSPTYDTTLLHDLLFEALRRPWYNDHDGTPSGGFWDENLFRRIDGVPLLQRRQQR